MGGRRRFFYLLHFLTIQIFHAGLAQCLSLPLTTMTGNASPSSNQLPCSSTSSSSPSVVSPPHTVVNFFPAGSSSSPKPRPPSSSASKPGQNLKISNIQMSLPNGDPLPPSSNLVISSYGTPTITSLTPKIEIPSSLGSLTSVNILPASLNPVSNQPTGVSSVQSGLPKLFPSSVQGSSNCNGYKPYLPPSVPSVNSLDSLGPYSAQNTLSLSAGSPSNQCNTPQQNVQLSNVTPNNDVLFGSNTNLGSNLQFNLPSKVNMQSSFQNLPNSCSQPSQISSNHLNSVSSFPSLSAQVVSQNGPSQVLTSPPSSSALPNIIGISQNALPYTSNLQANPIVNLQQASYSGVPLNNDNNVASNAVPSIPSTNPCSSNYFSAGNTVPSTQSLLSSVNIQQIANALSSQAQLANQLTVTSSPQNTVNINQPSPNIPVNFNYQQVSNCGQAANLPNLIPSNQFLPAGVFLNTVNPIPVRPSSLDLPSTGPNSATVSENLNSLVSEFVKKFLSTFDPNDFVQSVSNSVSAAVSPQQVVVSSAALPCSNSVASQIVNTSVNSPSVQNPFDSSLVTVAVSPQSTTVEVASDLVSSTDITSFPIVLPTASSPLSELPPLPPGYPAPLPPIIFGDTGKSSKGIKEFVKVLLLQQVLDGSNGCGCNGGADLDSLLALILAYM